MRTSLALLLIMFLAGCATSDKDVVPVDEGSDIIGYKIISGEIVFQFDPALYSHTTRNDNGQWQAIDRFRLFSELEPIDWASILISLAAPEPNA